MTFPHCQPLPLMPYLGVKSLSSYPLWVYILSHLSSFSIPPSSLHPSASLPSAPHVGTSLCFLVPGSPAVAAFLYFGSITGNLEALFRAVHHLFHCQVVQNHLYLCFRLLYRSLLLTLSEKVVNWKKKNFLTVDWSPLSFFVLFLPYKAYPYLYVLHVLVFI